MSSYDELSPKKMKKIVILGPLGFGIAILLGIILMLALHPGSQTYFSELGTVIETLTGPNPTLAYLIGSGLYSLNSTSPLLIEMLSEISLDVGATISSAMVPAILTWLITGLIIGFLAKKIDTGLYSAVFACIITWLFVIISSRIALLGDAILGALELGYAFIVFMMLVNSAISMAICGAGAILGALLYSKVIFRDRALIEDYM